MKAVCCSIPRWSRWQPQSHFVKWFLRVVHHTPSEIAHRWQHSLMLSICLRDLVVGRSPLSFHVSGCAQVFGSALIHVDAIPNNNNLFGKYQSIVCMPFCLGVCITTLLLRKPFLRKHQIFVSSQLLQCPKLLKIFSTQISFALQGNPRSLPWVWLYFASGRHVH